MADERQELADLRRLAQLESKAQFAAGQAARANPDELYKQAFQREAPTALKVGNAIGQGATFGFADEIGAFGTAAIEKLMGNERPFGDIRRESQQINRDITNRFAEESPMGALGAEVAGGLGVSSAIRAPAIIEKLAPAARAAVTGFGAGAAMGAGKSEGGIAERARDAVEVGVPSALFGVGMQQALRLTGAAGQRVARSFERSSANPTLQTLKTTKDIAYGAVDDSGAAFNKDQMMNLFMQSDDAAKSLNYVPEVDDQTKAALRMLEQNADKDLTIGQLDKLRQGLWLRYNRSGGSEPAIREMIDNIDNMIADAPDSNDLMKAARLANSRFKKAELLDEAFKKAETQTAATGSGGNILNKYRQAVTSIINNPKQAKWFSEPELEQMNQFIKGNWSQNLMRQVGKLSPTGNGLMTALSLGAIAVDPSMMGVSAAGALAKGVSDNTARTGAENLVKMAAGMPQRGPTYIPNTGIPAGVAGQAYQESRE